MAYSYINRENCAIYLLLTEFEVLTVNYGASVFPIDLWPKRKCHESYGKKRGSVTCSTDREDEVIVRYLLYLYCVSNEFGNGFSSRETASKFFLTLKGKRVNLKSF